MPEIKKLNIFRIVKMALSNPKVRQLLWCIAMSLLDDGKIDHQERTQIRANAVNLLEDILAGG